MGLLDDKRRLPLYFFIISSIGLTFYQLGLPSIIQDEGWSNLYVSFDWIKMFNAIRVDGAHPPLYYILLKLVAGSFGNSEFSLRFFSALASVVAVFFAWRLGEEIAEWPGAVAAGWYATFHPFMIYYARLARMYSLATTLAVILLFLYFRMENKLRKGDWLLAGVVMTAGLFIHYLYFVIAGVILIFAALKIKTNPLWFRKWVLVWGGAIIPMMSFALWFMSLPNPELVIAWIPKPDLGTLGRIFWQIPSGTYFEPVFAVSVFGVVVVAIILFGVLSESTRKLSIKIFVIGFIFPILALYLFSLKRSVFLPRYFFMLQPIIIALVALGAKAIVTKFNPYQKLQQGMPFIAIAVIVIGFGAGVQAHLADAYGTADWRNGVAHLQTRLDAEEYNLWLGDPGILVQILYYDAGKHKLFDIYSAAECKPACLVVQYDDVFPEECRIEDEWRGDLGPYIATCYVSN